MGIQTIPNNVPSLLSVFMTSIPAVPAVSARRNASLLSIQQHHSSMPPLHTCFVCLSFSKLCTSAFPLLQEALKPVLSQPTTHHGRMAGETTPHWDVLGGETSPALHIHLCTEALIFQGKNTSFTLFWMSMLSQQY